MNIKPAREEFKRLSNDYTHIPLVFEYSGDFDTPVSIYSKVRDKSPYSFLLESALQSGSSGRYSFIGFNPKTVIRSRNTKIDIFENGFRRTLHDKPVHYLRTLLGKYRIPVTENVPPFIGGLVGFFSYDAVRLFENIPDNNPSPIDTDDIVLLLVDSLIVYDHYHHTISIIVLAECGGDVGKNYSAGCEMIGSLFQQLCEKPEHDRYVFDTAGKQKIKIIPNMTPDAFMKSVETAKEYIRNGDIFQIVLSQRFSIKIETDAFNIYRCLRSMNPSPYMFYFTFDDTIVAGSSPEVMVKCINGIVTTRPLAGTRRRGFSEHEDRAKAEELLNDEKERAEHVMLVDLGRNDLGRFCRYGSIKIPEFMGIERYSHVMHIVSEVTGKLDNGRDSFDVLRGSFPAGTVSGAPKIRAMEIIDELEPMRRGIYSGAIGYIDFHKNLDTCIAIRTLVVHGDTVHIQAGAGIVADSTPESEYRETVQKARALINAVARAEGKLHDFGD